MAAKRKQRTRAGRAPTSAQERLLDTVHQIWLAGLGAVSKARNGAPQLLDELVSEGSRIHAQTRGTAEKALQGLLTGVQTGITERVGKARGQATDALEGLEKVFQTRVHRALTQLGVPSAEEVQSLSKRVDRLNANIEKLARKPGAPVRGNGRRKGRAHASITAT
jgi:poly(hydroxyalkanoate) granule-associated protein